MNPRFGSNKVSLMDDSTISPAVPLRRVAPADGDATIGVPYSQDDLFAMFAGNGSFSKHLLTVYSIAIGVNAKCMAEIGIGSSTRALLAACQVTGGRLYSCDSDKKRYSRLLQLFPRSKRWRLSLTDSWNFISQLPEAMDFVSHDGSHDAKIVLEDLTLIIPKMKKFGVVTLHDVQHPKFGPALIEAVKDVARKLPISFTILPYNCGLMVIRVEESKHQAITPAGLNKGSRVVTALSAI